MSIKTFLYLFILKYLLHLKYPVIHHSICQNLLFKSLDYFSLFNLELNFLVDVFHHENFIKYLEFHPI